MADPIENKPYADLPDFYEIEGAWASIDNFPSREEAMTFAQPMPVEEEEGRIGVASDTLGC